MMTTPATPPTTPPAIAPVFVSFDDDSESDGEEVTVPADPVVGDDKVVDKETDPVAVGDVEATDKDPSDPHRTHQHSPRAQTRPEN